MGKVLLLSLLGIVLLIGGVGAAYFGLTQLDQGGNSIAFLIGAVVLIGASVFLFIKIGQSDAMIVTKPKITGNELIPNEKLSIVDRNNEMSKDWHKTNQVRDRLKVLKMAEAAENGK